MPLTEIVVISVVVSLVVRVTPEIAGWQSLHLLGKGGLLNVCESPTHANSNCRTRDERRR
jgi:hypothetical protein